jgi:hypothetical protein
VSSPSRIRKTCYSSRALRSLMPIPRPPRTSSCRGSFANLVATNGTTLMNLGKMESALRAFDEARATFESLGKKGSPHAGVPIGSLSCTEKMGEAASRGGNAKLTAEYFYEVLKEVEPELTKPNADANIPYLAADSYSGLGDLELRKARQFRGNLQQEKENWMQAWAVVSQEPGSMAPHRTSPPRGAQQLRRRRPRQSHEKLPALRHCSG